METMTKQKNRLSFRMEKRADRYQLYFYDEIRKYGDFNWETWDYDESETSADMVKLQLDEIPDGSTIEVHVNSPGGEVGEGITIYNLLKQKSAAGNEIIGYVDGYAYSVAMNITMACDEIHMGLGTTMLLHYPWSVCAGNANELRAFAEQLDALGNASVQLYLARAKNITEKQLREMMEKETILDPETCLKYGFCDIIDEYEKKDKEPPESRQTLNQLKQAVFACQQAVKAIEGLHKSEPKHEMVPVANVTNVKYGISTAADCSNAINSATVQLAEEQDPETPETEPEKPEAEPEEKTTEKSGDDIDPAEETAKQTMCNTFIQAIRQMSAK